MHLQGPDSGDQDDGVRDEAGVAALDVEELLHPDVGAEAGLRHHKAVLPNQLEADLVRQDGRVAVGYVGKWSSMHKHRGALKGLKNMEFSHQCLLSRVSHLHQVGSDGVLHKDCEGTSHSQVFCCDWVTSPSDKKVDIEWDETRNWHNYDPNFLLAGCDHHLAQALPHVGEAGRQSQNCHDLTGWGVVSVLLMSSI